MSSVQYHHHHNNNTQQSPHVYPSLDPSSSSSLSRRCSPSAQSSEEEYEGSTATTTTASSQSSSVEESSFYSDSPAIQQQQALPTTTTTAAAVAAVAPRIVPPPNYAASLVKIEDTVESNELQEYDGEIMDFLSKIEVGLWFGNDNPLSSYLKPLSHPFLFLLQLNTRADPSYMENMQRSVTWRMRRTLIVWLVEVHKEYALRLETLYLTVNIIDRYCSAHEVDRSKFQLLGITALWVAAKYEENHGRVPNVKNLSYMCCDSYTEKQFILQERSILLVLGFDLGHPTAEFFLKRLLKLNSRIFHHVETRAMSRYLMEISLLNRRLIGISPNLIAQASVLLSALIVTGRIFRGVDKVEGVRNVLADSLADVPQAIKTKYAEADFCYVSVIAQRWFDQQMIEHRLAMAREQQRFLQQQQQQPQQQQQQHQQQHQLQGNELISAATSSLVATDGVPLALSQLSASLSASAIYESGQLTPPKDASNLTFQWDFAAAASSCAGGDSVMTTDQQQQHQQLLQSASSSSGPTATSSIDTQLASASITCAASVLPPPTTTTTAFNTTSHTKQSVSLPTCSNSHQYSQLQQHQQQPQHVYFSSQAATYQQHQQQQQQQLYQQYQQQQQHHRTMY